MHTKRLLAALGGAALLTAAVLSTPQANAAPTWAPAASAKIHPGTMMYTNGAQCTANFVYTDAAGATYVGYAAHCAGLGEATDTNGCLADSLPLGTRVSFNEGGSLLSEGTVVGNGTLVYSSWLTMHQLGTTDANACAYNDLALVKVDAADVSKVNPSVPFWGGPTGIDTDGTATGRPGLDLRQLQPALRHHPALAAHRHQPGRRRGGRRLVAPAVHRHAGSTR